MTTMPTFTEAVSAPELFGQHFRHHASFSSWWTFGKVLFGEPLSEAEIALCVECTGLSEPPTEPVKEAFLLIGRRGGKSRFSALCAAYLAAFIDWRPFLAPGERGYIVVIGADRRQCRMIMGYLRSFLCDTPLIADLIVRATAEELELSNGVTIEVATCSYRTIRSRTVIAGLCDEACFWASEDGSNPASEVIAALRPAMATIPNARLLCASSPYMRSGPCTKPIAGTSGTLARASFGVRRRAS